MGSLWAHRGLTIPRGGPARGSSGSWRLQPCSGSHTEDRKTLAANTSGARSGTFCNNAPFLGPGNPQDDRYP